MWDVQGSTVEMATEGEQVNVNRCITVVMGPPVLCPATVCPGGPMRLCPQGSSGRAMAMSHEPHVLLHESTLTDHEDV